MKVLHVSPSFYPSSAYGGTIRSGYGLCRSLTQLGCEVRVLTTDSNGPGYCFNVSRDRETELDGFRVRYCHKWFRNSVSPALIRALPEYVKWADVVHLTAVYSFPTLPTLFYSRQYDTPVIWSPRGALQRWAGSSRKGLKWIWESQCRRLAGEERVVLHTTSQAEAEQSLKRFPLLQAVVIPNGVNIPEKLHRTAANGELRLLYLGRLDPIKGVDLLLDTCQIVHQQAQDWCLRVAGSGSPSYVGFLKSKARQLGVSERVEFLGEISEDGKDTLFSECDVALVPSHVENFGIVVAEALAHSVPVIASKGTPWQALDTNRCGLWVDNHPESLAQAILEIRKMPLEEMGQRGRSWMERDFSWLAISRELLKLYRDCVRNDVKTPLRGSAELVSLKDS